jgi:hypothetical protein
MSGANVSVTIRESNEVLLRGQVESTLERLSRMLVQHVPHDERSMQSHNSVGDTVRFLGQLAAGWASAPPEAFPVTGAGFGSEVVVEDVDHGVRATYTLMAGPLLDIEQGHVSLASPIGRALLGRREREVITVQTPQRRRRLRVVSVRTLREQLADTPTRKPAA